MKKLVTLILLVLFSFENLNACTVHIESLRKTYRQSRNIFIGEIISTESIKKEEDLPEKLKEFKYLEKITFKIDKSWKGEKKQIVVYSSPFCECPMREYNFSAGNKFLVFADKNSKFDVCNLSNIEISSDKNKHSQEITKKLDSFGFRFWADIYPF